MEVVTCSYNSNDDIFICGLCKSIFSSLVSFLDHKKSPCLVNSDVNANNPIDVANQKISSEIESTLRSSQNLTKDHEETNKTDCNICQKSFKKYKYLEVHKKIHTSEKAYQCPVCGRCFIQSSHLQRHLQSHKVWPNGLSNIKPSITTEFLCYSCPFCEMTLSNYIEYRKHLKVHIKLRKFKCIQRDCGILFDTIDMLLDHIPTNHESLLYHCHLCSIAFKTLDEIALHHQEHKESTTKCDEKYKCVQCDATFKKKTALSLHMMTDNHTKICTYCQKSFVSDKRLRLHLQIHRNTKPYQCSICSLSFHMKKYLATHLLKHGERNHICTICNFKFKRRDLLTRHLKTHQMRKKLQCPFKEKLGCTMEFTRSDKLKLHIKYHTNRMDFVPKRETVSKNKSGATMEIVIIPVNNKDELKVLDVIE